MIKLLSLVRKEQGKIDALLRDISQSLPPLSQPIAKHILEAGGKRLRPILSILSGRICGQDSEDLYIVGASIEMIHAATLLHDDILDNASLRRGSPAAHTIFKPGDVILAGDIMLAKAMDLINELNKTPLSSAIAKAVINTAEGQISESANLHNPELNYDKYLEIITGKTAWLLRASCEAGAIAIDADKKHVEAIGNFGLELGRAFQLVDDALDYSPTQKTGKPSGGDLLEGKMTPPLVFYMESLAGEELKAFKGKFSEASFSPDEVQKLCPAIYELGSKKTRDLAMEHVRKGISYLDELPDNKDRNLLKKVSEYIISRNK